MSTPRISLTGADERAAWLQIAVMALGKIITAVETEEQKDGHDVVSLTVMPQPEGPGGAADIAASYADALMAEYQKRDTSKPR